MYRGAFQTKGYPLDVREHYLPNNYKLFSLSLARYYICTRFPNSDGVFLDEPRKKMYEKAVEMLGDAVLGVPQPDYSDDPELSGDTSLSVREDAALSLPWQRLLARPCSYGFARPYYSEGFQQK